MKNLIIAIQISCMVFLFGTNTANANSSSNTEPTNFNPSQNTVIAVSGLNLRTKPYSAGKIINKIPFGDQVEIIEDAPMVPDTLTSDYKYYYGQSSYSPRLSGNWVKVRYDGEEGYVFSAYLFYDWNYDNTFNKQTALLFEGSNCYENLHYRPDWHWYGVYQEGSATVLKKVKLSFFTEETELGAFLSIVTDIDAPSMFLFGTPYAYQSDRLLFSEYLGYEQPIYIGDSTNVELLEKASLEIKQISNNRYDTELYAVGRKGIRQKLSGAQTEFGPMTNLLWYGDLDGDGKMDYIIDFGEKAAHTVLFLSGKSEQGQLVKPVGVYYSGYCC